MAPPALNLKDASFKSLNAFSSATTPLRGSFSLSCRSPIIPCSHGSFLEPPTPHSNPGAAPRSPLKETSQKDDGHERSTADDLCPPTDRTRFLPRSPGLPPPPASSHDGKLGVLSAVNIIVGKTMGVGAYSVPSAVFSGVGSVGMTLALWVAGSLISFCGLAVYLDLGTAIPRSGGERVYLERVLRRPRMLATCMFMAYAVLLGFSTPNAIVLGEHVLLLLRATDGDNNDDSASAESLWAVRLVAVLSVTLICWAHARHPRLGMRLVDALGAAKLVALAVVVAAGAAGGLMGVGAEREAGSSAPPSSTAQRNFRAVWAGSSTQPYDYATALLKVLYCFRGYGAANQVLGEVRDPARTLRVAAPLALSLVSAAYLAVNVAFFLVVDKDEFRAAGVAVAGVFFRKVFGTGALGASVLPLFVVVSAAGNIAATSFAQARVNEELAREGVLPAFWRSDDDPAPERGDARPSSPSKARRRARRPSVAASSSAPAMVTPSRGLLLHWLVSVAAIVVPPPGKIFNFLVDIGGYPASVISVAVSLGLLHLHATPGERWTSPCRAPGAAVVVFAASNCLLLVLPWIPPRGGMAEDGRFPSYAYPATSLGVLALGAVYWVFWRTTARGGGGTRSGRADGLPSYYSCTADDALIVEVSSDADSDDGMLVVEEARCKSPEIPMADLGGKASQACGCQACPQVRRRAVCGCATCPARLHTRRPAVVGSVEEYAARVAA